MSRDSESDPGAEGPRRRALGGASAAHRARLGALDACGPCPERGSVLRREMLCRCPVALAARMLQHAERGATLDTLAAGERASLAFQERVLPTDLPVLDIDAVAAAAEALREAGHDATCVLPGCLSCAACARLDRATRGARQTVG